MAQSAIGTQGIVFMNKRKIKNLINRTKAGLSYRLGFSINKPLNVIFNLTNRCNLQCQHCDIWQIKDHHELNTTQWFDIINAMSSWLGSTEITLNGGEIFLRDDLFKIIDHLNKNNFCVAINSNGTLINEEVVDRLAQLPLSQLEISYYSLKPEVHDELRGTKGSWQKATKAIELLLAKRKKLAGSPLLLVAVMVNEKNYAELPEIIEWANENKIWISLQSMDVNFCGAGKMTGGGMWHKETPLWPKDFESFHNVWQKVMSMKKDGATIYNRLEQLQLIERYYRDPFSINELDCYAGQMNYIVDCDGSVYLCYRRGAIGSLLTSSPKNIWKGEEAKARREEFKSCLLTCRLMNCNYKSSAAKDLLKK